VRGYQVVTSDDRTVGRVADVQEEYVIVESGLLHRRKPVPKEFVHLRNGDKKVFVTVQKSVLDDAPRVRRDGSFDVDEADRHYGLAPSLRAEPVREEETPEHRAAELRRRLAQETAPEEAGAAPLTKHLPGEPPRAPERDFSGHS
jgi:hypothetical protein